MFAKFYCVTKSLGSFFAKLVRDICASFVGCARKTYFNVLKVRRLVRMRDPMLMGLQPSYSTS